MSQDAIQVITFFPSLIWQLFTGFKIPGLNMTPAVFFFGILSFGLAFRFLMGVINISTTGFISHEAASAREMKRNARVLKNREYRRNH